MRLQSIPDVSCYKPQAAFYLFPNVSALYKKEFKNNLIRNSYGLAFVGEMVNMVSWTIRYSRNRC